MKLFNKKRFIPVKQERTPVDNALYKLGIALSKRIEGVTNADVIRLKKAFADFDGIQYMNIPELAIAIVFEEIYRDTFDYTFTPEQINWLNMNLSKFFGNEFPDTFTERQPFYNDIFRYVRRIQEHLNIT